MVQVVSPFGKEKIPLKIQGAGFEDEYSPYLYNLRVLLALANSGPNTNGSQFYINQNKEDWSSKLQLSASLLKSSEVYKNGGEPYSLMVGTTLSLDKSSTAWM